VQCPQCKNDVPVTEAQFGALYTCPKCVAVYFVGFDGQPEYGSMEMPNVEMADESISQESASAPTETNFQPDYDFNAQNLNEESNSILMTDLPEVVPSVFSSVAQEISDYGNQEELISNISYDVAIKGLDTKEVMQAFKDAIEDSKFAWLIQDILSQIKNGEVTLKNLNPIQAFVLATRIQFLDLDIEWKQNVAF
jgi:hypothetical protein